eukprot:scaffold1549_cov156-Amphora_coffeaeformis.AAC.9
MFGSRISLLSIVALGLSSAWALGPPSSPRSARHHLSPNREDAVSSRRSVLMTWSVAGLLGTAATSASADTGAEVRGTDVTPFNGLAFQYRGSEFDGLKASDIDEPSVSYGEFIQRMKAGEVKFVEFLAPDGDKAYATFLGQDGKPQNPIRIGEGYPIEQHDGYSSPAFAIRAVKNAGVAYKFSVPALSAYKSS